MTEGAKVSGPNGTIPVTDKHRFDEAALAKYLNRKLGQSSGPLVISQFKGGQSNPTFYLNFDRREYVLRKKPPGKLIPKAHAIDREYKVMQALAQTDVPVPAVHLYCDDDSVIGTPFYVMDYLPGRILRDPLLPGMAIDERRAIYDAMNDTLARLHNVDWRAVGLADYGKSENYIARQVALWSRQYEATKEKEVPALEHLMRWLPDNIPADGTVSINHGDFRIENLMFDAREAKVIAVLDWELSTLGHPLCDLAFNCMTYHLPSDNRIARGFVGVDFEALGIPSEEKYVADYCARTGRDGIADWTFFMAFSLFRTAAIQQGIYQRAMKGNASSQTAHLFGQTFTMVAEEGWALVEQMGKS